MARHASRPSTDGRSGNTGKRNSRVAVLVGMVAVTLALTGCTNVLKSLSRSDITEAELRTTLLTASDLGSGWVAEQTDPFADQVSREALAEASDEICDVEAMVQGEAFSRDEGSLFVHSSAEPVCGGGEQALQVTRDDIDTLKSLQEQTLNAIAAEAGAGVRNLRIVEVDLGYGSNTLTLRTTADLVGEGGKLSYDQLSVVVANDRAAITIIMEAYDVPADTDQMALFVSKARTKLKAVE